MVLACTLAAHKNDDTTLPASRGENESVVINATLYSKPEMVKDLLGSDLGGHYIVVAVDVSPRFGKHVAITPDDFVLKTNKDGEHTPPFAPSQIAGRGVMVIRETGGSGGTPMWDNPGPIWGGWPGGGQPHRVGGNGVGNAGGPDSAEAKTRTGAHEKANPLEAVLTAKELPATKTDKPVSGLLYFPMEKQKVKDLELRYNWTGDKIVMRFRKER